MSDELNSEDDVSDILGQDDIDSLLQQVAGAVGADGADGADGGAFGFGDDSGEVGDPIIGSDGRRFPKHLRPTVAIGIQGFESGGNAMSTATDTVDANADWGAADYKNLLSNVITQIEAFDAELKTQASSLATNLATITTREEFSNDMINTLTEGADKLTLADLNEEGANLLALQTSNQLATQSLSLASQQSQSVLQLIG